MRSFTPMQTFSLIWFGQLVSLLGTAMTRFALMIWAYQQTGSATTLALLGFFSFIFWILLGPVAGVVVDRFDRRLIMLLTDLGAGLTTLSLLLLLQTDNLLIWHLYVAAAVIGALDTFQIPAYTATTSLLIPKKHYTRASGMRSLATNASTVLAPMFAGALLALVTLEGVLLVDIATFLVAMCTLFIVRVPRPRLSAAGQQASGKWWREMRFGFGYIWQRPGLWGLLLIYHGYRPVCDHGLFFYSAGDGAGAYRQ
jgi:MFS transporter, DHA3 family, macrolide efflux protein